MKYFAIDFETASREQVSACSLGIVSSGDEGIKDRWYELIRPPVMDFDDGCIRIHQIHPEDVKDKPEFPSYWEEIARLLEGQVVFAHNAPFDMGVLAGTVDYYDLPDIHFYWGDTVTLSRRLWKDKSHAPPVPAHETARIDKKQVLRSRPRGPARCAASHPDVPSAGPAVEIGSRSSPSFHANIIRKISTKVKSKNCRALTPGNSSLPIQPYTASWIAYRRSCTLPTSQTAAIGRPSGLTRKAITSRITPFCGE